MPIPVMHWSMLLTPYLKLLLFSSGHFSYMERLLLKFWEILLLLIVCHLDTRQGHPLLNVVGLCKKSQHTIWEEALQSMPAFLDSSKAFDKCQFDVLFKELIGKGFRPIVNRVIIYAYEEQIACVMLSGMKSSSFRISNGTRKGSILSPLCFPFIWTIF